MVAPLAGFAVQAAIGLAGSVVDGLSQAGSARKAASAAAGPNGQNPKAKAAADDFETMFLEQMVDRMLSGEGAAGTVGETGPGADVYRSMLAKEYASNIVKSGGLGISNQVYGEILKLQEGAARAGSV